VGGRHNRYSWPISIAQAEGNDQRSELSVEQNQHELPYYKFDFLLGLPLKAMGGRSTYMSPTLTIIVGGCLLGAVQLVVGIVIGLRLRRPTAGSANIDSRRARSLALGLHSISYKLGSAITGHAEKFEQMEQKLNAQRDGKSHPTTDLVVGVVGEILKANQLLQRELHKAENQIAEQVSEIESHLSSALTDPLTGLPNRRALDEQLSRRLEDYRKHGTAFSLLMIDADHFKQINDTFGHPVGDEVLVGIGGTLQAALRKHDFVARYGGEEFAVILPYTTLDEAQRAAGKVCEEFEQLSTKFAHLDRTITVSGGLASIVPGESVTSLIGRADEALYAAKHNGRDQTYRHDGSQCRPLDGSLAAGSLWAQPSAANDSPESSDPKNHRSEELTTAVDDLRAALLEAAEVE